jgi:hypothetical protein
LQRFSEDLPLSSSSILPKDLLIQSSKMVLEIVSPFSPPVFSSVCFSVISKLGDHRLQTGIFCFWVRKRKPPFTLS